MDALCSHVLGVTQEDAKVRIRRIVSNFQVTMPAYTVSLRFTNASFVRGLLRLPEPNLVGSGRTRGLPTKRPSKRTAFDDGFCEKIPVEIGMGLVPDNGYIPDAMFAKLIAVTYHELSHVDQAFWSSRFDSYPDQLMSLQRLAVRNNRSFYKANHSRLLSEVDADLTACENMTDYMRREFPSVEHSDLDSIIVQGFLLSNDNKRLTRYDDLPITTPEQLQQRLREFAVESVNIMPKFPDDYHKSDDELACLFKSKSGVWAGIRDEVECALSARDAYLKLASIQCFLHPYMRAHYLNVRDIDMLPEHVFESGLPESRDAALKHVAPFYLEPYEFVDRFFPVVRDVLFNPKTVLDRDGPPDEIEYPEPQAISSSRDTSDLDQAVESITRRDAGPGSDYDIS